MDQIQNNAPQQTARTERPGFAKLWADIKKYKRLYYKVLPVTFIVAAILTLSMPNYYSCTVMLAPEMSGAKGGGSLSSLASSFGINLGGASAGADALMPTLYPDLMNSVTFRASLFPIKVYREDDSTKTEMTYYDYLKDGQKAPWWSEGMKAVGEAIGSFFGKEELVDEKVNTFKLTKEQTQIVKAISKKVVCDVDKKTMVITINVTDQDPLIAATMADSVQTRLQRFITDYRTRKARIDLEYNQKICAEAKERYDNARKNYADYADANQKIFLERARSRQSELETELQLQQRAYSQIAAQLQLAEAKVQEETPAFTTLQPATVPIQKDGPKRSRICLIFLFLAFLATTAYAFHKEGDLIPLFTADDEEPEPTRVN